MEWLEKGLDFNNIYIYARLDLQVNTEVHIHPGLHLQKKSFVNIFIRSFQANDWDYNAMLTKGHPSAW